MNARKIPACMISTDSEGEKARDGGRPIRTVWDAIHKNLESISSTPQCITRMVSLIHMIQCAMAPYPINNIQRSRNEQSKWLGKLTGFGIFKPLKRGYIFFLMGWSPKSQTELPTLHI